MADNPYLGTEVHVVPVYWDATGTGVKTTPVYWNATGKGVGANDDFGIGNILGNFEKMFNDAKYALTTGIIDSLKRVGAEIATEFIQNQIGNVIQSAIGMAVGYRDQMIAEARKEAMALITQETKEAKAKLANEFSGGKGETALAGEVSKQETQETKVKLTSEFSGGKGETAYVAEVSKQETQETQAKLTSEFSGGKAESAYVGEASKQPATTLDVPMDDSSDFDAM